MSFPVRIPEGIQSRSLLCAQFPSDREDGIVFAKLIIFLVGAKGFEDEILLKSKK
jgi:hypothetical protein